MTRQAAIGAVLGFVVTAILLAVCGRQDAAPQPPDAGTPMVLLPRAKVQGEPRPLPEAKVHVRSPIFFLGVDGGQ